MTLRHLVHRSFQRRRGVCAAVAVAAVVAAAIPAAASAYIFRPGDPIWLGGHRCTGGYAIRGTLGMFLLTAGHCGGTTVSGTSYTFADVAWTMFPSGVDTELIKERPPNDAYQTVRDPRTGALPGGSGKVVGWIPDYWLTRGVRVGKMGSTTGWTEGVILDRRRWYNGVVYCGTYAADHGDSGGPVWRAAPGGGVYAVGIHVGRFVGRLSSESCFISIEDLLRMWGANLPQWTSAKSLKAVPTVGLGRGGKQPPLVRDPNARLELDG